MAATGKVHGTPVLGFSGEIPMLAYGATAGVDIRKQASLAGLTDSTVGTQLIFGGAVGLLLADKMLQIGPEVYGTTVMVGPNRFSRTTTNVEGILGLRARLAAFVLGAGAGPGFTRGMGTPALRALLSVAYAPEPAPPLPPPRLRLAQAQAQKAADRDHDGIPDKNDACPDEPGVASDDPRRTVARCLRLTAMVTALQTPTMHVPTSKAWPTAIRKRMAVRPTPTATVSATTWTRAPTRKARLTAIRRRTVAPGPCGSRRVRSSSWSRCSSRRAVL